MLWVPANFISLLLSVRPSQKYNLELPGNPMRSCVKTARWFKVQVIMRGYGSKEYFSNFFGFVNDQYFREKQYNIMLQIQRKSLIRMKK